MKCGGKYGKLEHGTDYDFVGLYANGDYCTKSYKFEGTNKKYRMGLKEHLVMRQRRMFLYILAKRKLEQLDLLELRCRSSLLNLK